MEIGQNAQRVYDLAITRDRAAGILPLLICRAGSPGEPVRRRASSIERSLVDVRHSGTQGVEGQMLFQSERSRWGQLITNSAFRSNRGDGPWAHAGKASEQRWTRPSVRQSRL